MEQNNNDQSLRDAVRDALQDAMRDQHQMMQQMLQTMQAMMARMEVQNRAQPVREEEHDEVDGGQQRGFKNFEAPPIRREQQRRDVGLPSADLGMAPIPERAVAAVKAMKAIGFSGHAVKPVLKNLLKESKDAPPKNKTIDADLSGKNKEVLADDEPEPYRTRIRIRQEDDQLAPDESLLKRQKLEACASPEIHLQRKRTELCPSPSNLRSKAVEPVSPQTSLRQEVNEGISPQPSNTSERGRPILPQMNSRETRASTHSHHQAGALQADSGSLLKTYRRGRQPARGNPGNAVEFKEPKIEPGTDVLQENDMADLCTAPIRPKDEPYDDDSIGFEAPIAVIYPSHPVSSPIPHPVSNPIPAENAADQDERSQDDPVMNASTSQANVAEASAVQHDDRGQGKEQLPIAAFENGKTSELVSVQEASSTSIDIASSASGEVKLSLMCSPDHPDFRMPSLEAILKMVEDRCLKSYKILQPDFSLMNVMKEMCQCALELGSESAEDKQESFVKITPALESLKKSVVHDIFGGAPCSFSASPNLMMPEGSGFATMNGIFPNQNLGGESENGQSKKNEGTEVPEASDITCHSLVVVQLPQLALGDIRPLHDVNDISKGEERVRISVVNEFSSEKYPSSFQYIPRNVVYQNAFVDVSLARIGDEDCCADCFGDCVAAAIPCACARETGGEFAYTSDGLLKKKFLDECISMNRDPQKHHHFYCKHCPIERSKNEVMPDPCKGHLVRKFVKECWSKCGCSKQCGNRVVQRGITFNFQVFFTAEGKGWGLRTLEDLPRGSFVCEYVGEILTNLELYDRTMQTTVNAKHTYPVLLDADWGSEGVLKDEEALCLDATFYGNVARFINHRCFDANLVEVPVEVETPGKVSQKVEDRVSDLQEIHASVRAKLEETYAKYKAKADQRRRQQSFEVGDMVWVYLPRERYPQGAFTKLKPKKIGPCQVLEKFGDNAYRVELPDDVFISDVFNIRHLTPYAGENSSLRSSFSEAGESDEDISSDQGSGQSNQALDVPVPATQNQQTTSGKPAPGSLRRSKRLQNKQA